VHTHTQFVARTHDDTIWRICTPMDNQVIGRGAFGEVRLCRRAQDDEGGEAEMYAIKMLRKKEMRQKDQVPRPHLQIPLTSYSNTSYLILLIARARLLRCLALPLPRAATHSLRDSGGVA